MKKIKTYLSRLRFDPKLSDHFITKYLSNPRLVILIIFMIITLGLSSFLSLPRVLNPEIKIPIVLVTAPLPGAGPEDVESLVTVPIEDAVNGVPDVKTVTSSSQNSVSVVSIEFNSGVDPDKARTDVQSAVDGIDDFPSEVQSPNIQKLDFQNQPVWTFIVTGSKNAGSLEQFAQVLKRRLEDLPRVKNVTISGLPEQEVQILIKQEAIANYKINPQQIVSAIRSSLGSYPSGSVRTDSSTFALSIDRSVITVDDLRSLRVNINGNIVMLSDIATISERSKPDQVASLYADINSEDKPAITFNVFKTASANITDAASDAEKEVEEIVDEYHDVYKVSSVVSAAEEINDQFGELIRDFSITIVLVFLTLFVFVGIRQAFVALLSSPLTFFITFIVMQITDISLSFIAIFSLLLSLGLLVDDTVVVISAVTSYFRTRRFTPLQAGVLVFRDFLVVIFTTTITTVWAFLPILLSTGIIGEFIKGIPIVVSTTLIASFFVAMFIILPVLIIILEGNIPQRVKIFLKTVSIIILIGILIAVLPKGPLFPIELLAAIVFLFVTARIRRRTTDSLIRAFNSRRRKAKIGSGEEIASHHGLIDFDIASGKYKRIMDRILRSRTLRRRTIAMVVIFSIFSYLLFPLGLVKNEFFPKSDTNYMYVTLELPPGTNTITSYKEAKRLINEFRKTEGVSFVSADIGQSFSQESFGAAQSGSNNILFSFVLLPKGERENSLNISEKLREKYSSYQKGKIQIIDVSGGPPAGADVQIKLFGENLETLDKYANSTVDFLEKQPGLANIDKSIKPGTSKLVFVPDRDKLAQAGLTPDMLGFWLRLFSSGFEADSIRLENDISNDEKDITIRLNSNPQFAESISSIIVPTSSGNIPLASLGKINLAPNPTLITREDGKRTISVTASVQRGFSVSDANKKLEEFANDGLSLEQGYSWATGGVNEENQNSVNSILQAMVLSFLLIIVTMVIQFSSFRRALIVMLVIPLSISGVFIIFALTQTPLSFPALIGILALFGIVVKNSILVVDKILQNQKIGMDYIDSIVDAAGSRLEPIALTSFATIAGLIPITLSNPLWRGLGGAIISGLAFSGTIMLFFIPVVYFYLFKPKNIK